jgi:hypothetical protein
MEHLELRIFKIYQSDCEVHSQHTEIISAIPG